MNKEKVLNWADSVMVELQTRILELERQKKEMYYFCERVEQGVFDNKEYK